MEISFLTPYNKNSYKNSVFAAWSGKAQIKSLFLEKMSFWSYNAK